MNRNLFRVRDLPLIPDYLLIQTGAEYRQVYQMLNGTRSDEGKRVRQQVREALHAITEELQARHIQA